MKTFPLIFAAMLAASVSAFAADNPPDRPSKSSVQRQGAGVSAPNQSQHTQIDSDGATRKADDRGAWQSNGADLVILFPSQSSDLTENAKREIDQYVRSLAPDDFGSRFFIAGYSDAKGSADYNLKLSEERAGSVRDYLVRQWGFDPSRILVHGWGEARLRYPNEPEFADNRRVEISRLFPVDETGADQSLMLSGPSARVVIDFSGAKVVEGCDLFSPGDHARPTDLDDFGGAAPRRCKFDRRGGDSRITVEIRRR